jgi:catechol 2,3-dioxygenase-like lactoylglutathione lyase family enzyme
MSTQISAITLGVSDINRARRFYSEGLGCPVGKDHGTFVTLSLGDGSSALALYPWDALAADAGVTADSSGFRDFTLSWIAGSAAQVDVVLAAAGRAGGAITKPAKRAFWGGYSGYFTDPDGYHWKVASPNGPPMVRRRPRTRPHPDAPVTLKPQQTCVTIGANDIKRARQFYSEGLGCHVDKSYSKFVSFKLGAASSTLALYTRDGLAADAGVTADGHGFHGFTLSCIAGSAGEADEMLAAAGRAGGAITKPAESESWGGYGGYFTNPDGNLWKVASGA